MALTILQHFTNQFNDQLPVGLIAQLVRELHRYRRGQGLNPGKPDFFRLSFRNCISCVNNCEDLLYLFLHSAVQIYEFHIFIISFYKHVAFCSSLAEQKKLTPALQLFWQKNSKCLKTGNGLVGAISSLE